MKASILAFVGMIARGSWARAYHVINAYRCFQIWASWPLPGALLGSSERNPFKK